MATVFWYYPTGGNRAAAVNLGAAVMDRDGPTPTLFGTHTESVTGAVVSTTYGGRWSLRYRHTWDTRGTGRTLRRQLFALVNHLQRGGSVMVAENSTYAFAAFATMLPTRLTTRLDVGRNLFEVFAANVDLTDRELVIQSDPDTFYAEMRVCSAHSGALVAPYVDISTDLAFPYASDAKWVLVREAGSWPAMRLPPSERSSPILTHRYEQVYELDLPLEEDPDAIESLQSSQPAGTSSEGVDAPPEVEVSAGDIRNGWIW